MTHAQGTPTVKAEIISIGSELTSGQNLDTNSQWLSRRLAEMGIPVRWHTTLADDLDENIQAFQIASQRAQLVFSTGGLGPTQDDLTREVLARVVGVPLELHQASLATIQEMFSRRGRAMPELNRVQALCPRGGAMIPNQRGTAPGIRLKTGSTLFIAMPGPPSEMFFMWENAVRSEVQQLAGGSGVLVQRKLNTFGWGESMVEEKLLDLTRRGHVPEVGITVGDAVISLRILAKAADLEAAQRQIDPVEKIIRERLGELVFGVEDEDLHDVVALMLQERRLTIATAESVTGGLIAHRLATVPGVSENLLGGVVAYTNQVKRDWLGVPQELLDEHGAVSAPVAEAMARGCRERFSADLALSTTGLAGPGGGTAEKPVGLVFAAVAWRGGVKSNSMSWIASRGEIQSRTAKMALNLARLHLLTQPSQTP